VDGRSVVYIQVGNSIEARPVRAGLRDGSWVEIAQGLVAGDRVLVDPPEVPEEVVR
jgi:multidrug efflux pump subunit AcrA (membrane-fusion protein)